MENNKKWYQLKKKQQIIVATKLRDLYIKFVIENKRKPNRDEKQFIVATVYTEIEEEKISVSANEISKYFESKLSNYDKSIEKLGFTP